MNDAERMLVRPNEASLEIMDNLVTGSGYDSKQDVLNEIATKAQEENNQIEFSKDIYADPAWWGNADTWPQKIEGIKNEKVLTQRDFLQQFDSLLQGDLNTNMGNAPAIKEIMFRWKESQSKDDNKNDVNDAYMGILGQLRSPMFSQQYNMIKENYAQIINLIQSIGYMDDALIREGPRQN